MDDWEDICFAVGSHSNRQNSGGTLYRLVADGIGDGPPKIGFGTNNSQRYGIKIYKSGSTEVCSKELKRHWSSGRYLFVCLFGVGLRNSDEGRVEKREPSGW